MQKLLKTQAESPATVYTNVVWLSQYPEPVTSAVAGSVRMQLCKLAWHLCQVAWQLCMYFTIWRSSLAC